MSTKTTFKRVALVAVAALGFGVLTSVAPASATPVYTTSITVTTSSAPVAGVSGSVVTHTVRFATATTAAVTISPKARIISAPAGSTLALQAEGGTTAVALAKAEFGDAAADTTDATDFGAVNNTTETTVDVTGFTNKQGLTYLHAWYDVPGTYTWAFWDDDLADGVVNGLDVSTTFSVVVAATGTTATYSATATAQNASAPTGANDTSGVNGSLVKISLTSGGSPVSPDNAGGVKVTVNNSADIKAVNASNVTATTTWTLGQADFDGLGNAYINVTDAVAETVLVTLSGVGSMASSLTVGSPVVLTFTAPIATATALMAKGALTGMVVGTAATATTTGAATAPSGIARTTSFALGTSSATAGTQKTVVVVTDTSGAITGKATAKYNLLVSDGATGCTYCGTFSVATPATFLAGYTYTVEAVTTAGTTGLVVTGAAQAVSTLAVTAPNTTIRALTGSSASFTVTAKDQYGLVIGNVAVAGSIAGRNSAVNMASAITSSTGLATLTYTDASTSTTSMTDTITFSATTGSATATVNFTTVAGLGVTTVLATTSQTSATTGADLTTITPFAVAAGSLGVEAGAQTVTITVKDVNGIGILGVPVTVSVAGSGAAVLSTKQTVYTDATGVATSSVYAWLAPTYGTNYVVTATAGGVSDTVNSYWAQSTALHVRNFTATAAGRVITVVAKDRLGNPVLGAEFTARITAGDGFFGTGTNIATGSTDSTGTLKFVTLESPTPLTVVVQAGGSATYGQTDAPAGNVSTADALDVFVAATAGTATTAETGVGATFAPAGNNTATVTIEPSVSDAATAADAAAEATDAANAATDAANAAAEAADAATAAAQDAADAVAALSTQVSEMVNALKKQITALTNLVIKIQKKVRA